MLYHRKLRRLKIDKARQEIQDKKELDKAKHEFAEKLKRKLAIQAMLNTMNVRLRIFVNISFSICSTGIFLSIQQEKDKIQLAIEKEKAARRVEVSKIDDVCETETTNYYNMCRKRNVNWMSFWLNSYGFTWR